MPSTHGSQTPTFSENGPGYWIRTRSTDSCCVALLRSSLRFWTLRPPWRRFSESRRSIPVSEVSLMRASDYLGRTSDSPITRFLLAPLSRTSCTWKSIGGLFTMGWRESRPCTGWFGWEMYFLGEVVDSVTSSSLILTWLPPSWNLKHNQEECQLHSGHIWPEISFKLPGREDHALSHFLSPSSFEITNPEVQSRKGTESCLLTTWASLVIPVFSTLTSKQISGTFPWAKALIES